MNIRQSILASLSIASVAVLAAVPEVDNVTMVQAPNRLVTITYTLSDAPAIVTLDIETNANTSAAADDPGWASIGGEAVCNAQGDVWKKVSGKATYTIKWQPDQSWKGANGNGFKIAANGARAVVTAWALDNPPDYMVADLAAANTVFYYPGVNFLPGSTLGQTGAITNNTAYRMSKLVMRKIMAAGVKWTMGSADGETQRESAKETAHAVTLLNNYYIGVFEITQAQWQNIATNNASKNAFFTVDGNMRPVVRVSYCEIRENSTASGNASYYWPAPPNPSSFLGLLRRKTGLDFDLPTEAQWEFAARAGYGSGCWSDGSAVLNGDSDNNLARLGRYRNNGGGTDNSNAAQGPTSATAIAGSYAPSDWGLYDMHGNVLEWCLDWYADNITEIGGAVNIDPDTPANALSTSARGSTRVLRGGGWSSVAGGCRAASRAGVQPQYIEKSRGFRVACPISLE